GLGIAEDSAWTVLGRLVSAVARLAGIMLLYGLRFILAPAETAKGLRRMVLNAAPLPAAGQDHPAPEAVPEAAPVPGGAPAGVPACPGGSPPRPWPPAWSSARAGSCSATGAQPAGWTGAGRDHRCYPRRVRPGPVRGHGDDPGRSGLPERAGSAGDRLQPAR